MYSTNGVRDYIVKTVIIFCFCYYFFVEWTPYSHLILNGTPLNQDVLTRTTQYFHCAQQHSMRFCNSFQRDSVCLAKRWAIKNRQKNTI